MDPRDRIEPTFGTPDTATTHAAVSGSKRRPQAIAQRVPRGLAIVAGLAIVGGLAGVILQLYAYQELKAAFSSIGMQGNFAAWTLLILSLLAMVSGGLALEANKLGWMLLLALVTYESVASIQALMLAHNLGLSVALMDETTISPYTRYAGKLTLEFLVIIYLLRGRVRAFFQLRLLQTWAFVGALIVVAAASIALAR
jgi:hypothetical protein